MILPFLFLLPIPTLATYANDTLGWENGYTTLSTTNFDILLIKDSQTLASLKPKNSTFDFLPLDFIELRSADGQYHTGDITYRYREDGQTAWTSGDSSTARIPVSTINGGPAAANLENTLPSSTLNVTREWTDIDGDLGLLFTLTNTGIASIEVGSLGFPLEFNSIFTGRTAEETQSKCSLHDPYIGLDAGYVQVTPLSGTGKALVVTPIGKTPFEAWRNLEEVYVEGTGYGSQVFEGFYEWMTLSKAYAENEWKDAEPWNDASSLFLEAGKFATFGLRFSLADDIRGIETAVKDTGTPLAVGVPGYIVPADLPAQLYLFSDVEVESITTSPADALTFTLVSTGKYTVTAIPTTWGRVRATVTYSDGRVQTVHYYITKAASTVLSDLGDFATTIAWFNDTDDPFGRAPSPLTYDSRGSSVTQDSRVWIAGLSDEGGVGMYLAATLKQAALPSAPELSKLELFIDQVLSSRIQNSDFSVKKSIFFYDPSILPSYPYSKEMDWTSWTSWNEANAYKTDRAYDYVHPIAAYWAMYRAGRAYPELLSLHGWEWYLERAYRTVLALMKPDQYGNCCEVGYALVGLMEETVIGELLKDLEREGWGVEAGDVRGNMSVRAEFWEGLEVPFGSEMAWDSTGQEGVYYWANYFNHTNTVTKAINSILGYMPTVAHWGWNGNARRYWDNLYASALPRIERQIHHYGSALNALPLLSHLRSNPQDTYLLRLGYAGISGPLSSNALSGFPSASFHSWPDTLAWDFYSGDYGTGFVGLILGTGTYIIDDPSLGTLVFGGFITSSSDTTYNITTCNAIRRKVWIGPFSLSIEIDAGIISSISFFPITKEVTLVLSQLEGVPVARAAMLWIESEGEGVGWEVKGSWEKVRGAWEVVFGEEGGEVIVEIGVA